MPGDCQFSCALKMKAVAVHLLLFFLLIKLLPLYLGSCPRLPASQETVIFLVSVLRCV